MHSRFLKLSFRAFLSNLNLPLNPYKLTFAVTYSCNSRCKHCNIWRIKPKNELSLDEIEEFAKKSNFFYWYNLTGGEPFLRKDYIDLIKVLLENSKNFYLLNSITNAFNPDLIASKLREILELKIPRVIYGVSLDGYKELHEYIRGVKGSFENALNTFKLFKDLEKEFKNFRTYFGYTLSPLNLGEFKKTFETVKEKIPSISIKDFHVNLFHLSNHYYSNLNLGLKFKPEDYRKEVMEELNQIIKLKKMSTDPVDILDPLYLKLARNFIKKEKSPLPCKAIETSVFIDPQGNVYPCSIWNKKLGNLRKVDYNLKKILKSKEAKKVKLMARVLKCPNCWTPCEAYQTILGNLFNQNVLKNLLV